MKGENMKHVYILLWETEMWGAWEDPCDAVRWLLKDKDDDKTIHGETDVGKIAKKMLTSDYPALVRIPINPTGEPWYMDR